MRRHLKKLVHIVGARPNFMKAAPLVFALKGHALFQQKLVHTGQHYDANMSDVFFTQLGMPLPDVNLNAGSGSHAVQTAQIMIKLDELFQAERPDCVIVYGDVNSTVAAALVCAKLQIKVAHVEAGLRSFDLSMPEEINRMVTDRLADLLFTPSEDGDRNLQREGVVKERIYLVGNLMIDTLVRLMGQASARWSEMPQTLQLTPDSWHAGRFALATLHRPVNVDDPARLRALLAALEQVATQLPVIFPVHPRTRRVIEDAGID